jgi:hypothetical protein
MIFKRHKSISWKTAFGIVVFLHLAVYGAVTQYSSYKKKLAEELKNSKEKLYAEKESKPEWNNNHLKPRVVGIPTPQKTQEKENVSTENKVKNLIENSVNGANNVLTSLNGVKNTFQSEIKKIDNPFSKEIKLIAPTPKKSVTKVSSPVGGSNNSTKSVQPKHQSRPLVKVPSTPQQKPIQIKPNFEPSSQIKVRNIVIESDGSIVETTEEIRRVISSHVIL